MEIKKAEFVISAVKPTGYPETDMSEVAFVGRSNVGKSSLINTITNRRKLVKVSQTPGKTKLVNFFIINDAMRERNRYDSTVTGDFSDRGHASAGGLYDLAGRTVRGTRLYICRTGVCTGRVFEPCRYRDTEIYRFLYLRCGL